MSDDLLLRSLETLAFSHERDGHTLTAGALRQAKDEIEALRERLRSGRDAADSPAIEKAMDVFWTKLAERRAREARDAALEEAAIVCEKSAAKYILGASRDKRAALQCAREIRALKAPLLTEGKDDE